LGTWVSFQEAEVANALPSQGAKSTAETLEQRLIDHCIAKRKMQVRKLCEALNKKQ
jgi:BarA-like signal transduction histidine kinase